MDFSKLKTLNLPQGRVKELSINGNVVWKKNPEVKPNFESNTWVEIIRAFKGGYAPSTWVVGDEKELKLTNNYTIFARIADLKPGRYTYASGNKTTSVVFEFEYLLYNHTWMLCGMNGTADNSCGWKNSAVMEFMPQFEPLLPPEILAELDDILVPATTGLRRPVIENTPCKLFIPAETELFDSRKYSFPEAIQGQFEYYRLHNTDEARAKHTRGSETDHDYWLRSAYYNNDTSFCYVTSDGSASYELANRLKYLYFLFAV